MRSATLIPAAFALAAAGTAGAADLPYHGKGAMMVQPDELEWTEVASMAPPAQIAVIEGDLSAERPFTMRLKLPADYRIEPHVHPAYERVTVLSGTLHFAHGEDAERMEDEAMALERDIAGRDHRLSGRLRVTSSETLAYRLLTGQLAAFREAHPGVMVELAIDNRVLSLSRREADIALRPVRPREGDLWGRKLSDIAWTFYGRRDRLAGDDAAISIDDLGRHPLIGWDDGAARIGAAAWLESVVPDGAVVFRTSSLIGQLVAAKSGIGLAVLPCYLGDPEPDLVRALPSPVAELGTELWIVTHKDLRRTARVRAFFDLIGDGSRTRARPVRRQAGRRASRGCLMMGGNGFADAPTAGAEE